MSPTHPNPNRDAVKARVLQTIEKRGPVAPKTIYSLLDNATQRAFSLRAVSEMLYELRDAQQLVALGDKAHTRYDTPTNVQAREKIEREHEQQAQLLDEQRSSTRAQSAAQTRRELEKARALLQRYGHLLPDGWKSLAVQIDTEQLEPLLDAPQIVEQSDEQTIATAQQQPETRGAILLSELSQRVAQHVAVLVEQTIGNDARASQLLIDAYKRKIKELEQRVVELESEVCIAQEATRQDDKLRAAHAELELRVEQLLVDIGQRDADIVQLRKDVETALATAEEQTKQANDIRERARALLEL